VAVNVYRSSDSSAPTLSGTAGDLVNLLDKTLVSGYGSKTAAGWSKPYTGTNSAVFRMGAGNQFYLDVNDNGPGAATAQEARVRGYETMSAVATGTGPFPTTAQLSAGIVVRKSAAASGTTRTWCLIADDRTFYLFVQTGDVAGQWWGFSFGDLYSYVTGTDNYRTVIIGRVVENSASGGNEWLEMTSSTVLSTLTGHYMARVYTGLGGSVNVGKVGDNSKGIALGSALRGVFAVPHPVDGAVWLSPVFVNDSTVTVRGKLRGFYHYLHTVASFTDQDTVAGAGVYSGHTFLLFKTTGQGGVHCIDITGAWDTN
jgi:hypothetical protein